MRLLTRKNEGATHKEGKGRRVKDVKNKCVQKDSKRDRTKKRHKKDGLHNNVAQPIGFIIA